MSKGRLKRLLSRANDEDFFALVWGLDALQSGREDLAARILEFPLEAATSDPGAPLAIHRWELESLMGQLLVTEKAPVLLGLNRQLNCRTFKSAQALVNCLRVIENADAGQFLKHFNVLLEMHRIAQRQFEWQRGFNNVGRVYRYGMIYGQGRCNIYFEDQYGLSINDFSFVGFAISASLSRNLWINRHAHPFDELGVDQETLAAALRRLSKPILEARRKAAAMANALGRGLPIAYQPSFLRQFPIVSFGDDDEKLYAPIPDLILFRITSGLYYDLAPGGQALIGDANDRFEEYVEQFITAVMPRFEASRSYRYGTKKNGFDSPDVIVRLESQVALVIECKATKLTFDAQYAEDPKSAAESAYDQIAKGVFQLWRYFSHARRGVAGIGNVSPDAHGMLLTLDTWLTMAPDLQKQVIAAATEIAAEKDPEISEEDRRPIVFCAIEDLEDALRSTDETSFMASLSAATDEGRFLGWALSSIWRKIQQEENEPKPYPFDVSEVLPWWGAINDRRS